MKAEDMLALVEARREKFLRGQWSAYAQNNPIASNLPDCERALALGLLAWNERPHPGPAAVERMMSGRGMERTILQDMRDEGWIVVQEQVPFQIRDKKGRVILSGRSEGKIQPDERNHRALVSFEIKDTSQYVFERIETEDDLRVDQWTRKWWRQCQAYMLAHNEEWMLLFITHRRRRKHLIVHLDFAAAEEILRRAEQTIDLQELLRGHPVEDLSRELTELEIAFAPMKECSRCDFYQRVCFPPTVGVGEAKYEDIPELEAELSRYAAIQQVGKEYESLHRKFTNEKMRGRTIVAGNYVLTGVFEEQNQKAQAAKPAVPAGKKKIWRSTVMKAGAPVDPQTSHD